MVWAMLQDGWALVRRGPWQWLAVVQGALAASAACYLLVVRANSTRYHYSFWNDPPPTGAAEHFAVVSLWALAVVVSGIGCLAYGALCQLALDAAAGGPATAFRALRRSAAAAVATAWWAVPTFAATAAAVLLILPGLTILPLVAGLPFAFLDRAGHPLRRHRQWLRDVGTAAWVASAAIEAAVASSAVAVIVGLRVATLSLDRFVPAVAVVAIWAAASAVGVVVCCAVAGLATVRDPVPPWPG